MFKVWKVWGYDSKYTESRPLYVINEDSYKALTKARRIDKKLVAVQLFLKVK